MPPRSSKHAAACGGDAKGRADKLGKMLVVWVRHGRFLCRHPKDDAYVSLLSIVENLHSRRKYHNASLTFIKDTILRKTDGDGHQCFHVKQEEGRMWIAAVPIDGTKRRRTSEGEVYDGVRESSLIENALAALKCDEIGAWTSA
jgi:hypothetical protein